MSNPRTILHSFYVQLSQTQTISPDTRAPAIGIIVRQHDQSRSNILTSMPRLTSIESGEFVSIEDTETTVREKALEIAERCRLLSAELLRHAKRMSEVATRDKVIDDAAPTETPSRPSEPRYIEVFRHSPPITSAEDDRLRTRKVKPLTSSLLASISKHAKGNTTD